MLSDYAQNKITDALRRGQALGAPATMYFGLFTVSKGARASSTAYALNDTVVVRIGSKYSFYKVTTAGTTAAAQPGGYLGVVGEAITDGSAVLTEQSNIIDAAGFVEAAGPGYARVAVVASLANFSGTQGAGTTAASTGTNGTSSNNGAITWPVPTGAWHTAPAIVAGFFWSDAATGGNMWEWAPLADLKNVNAGDPAPTATTGLFTFQIGS